VAARAEARTDVSLDADLVSIEHSLTVIARHLTRSRLHERIVRELRAPLDRAGAVVLRLLGEWESARLTDLAVAANVDVSTLSRQVRVLVDHGLVARTTDPDDGRAFRLALTAAGRAALDRLATVRRMLVGELLGDWSDADRAALAPLLERLAADLGRSAE